MSKKLGFILSSGAVRGIAHVGFLQAMEEEGIKPDVITGCSMGSIVGGCYLAGKTPKEMKEIALSLKAMDIFDLNLNPLRKKSLFASKKMRSILTKLVGDIKIEDLPLKYGSIACDLVSGKTVSFTEGSLVDAMQASSSIPTVFAGVEKDGMFLIDGGVLERCPITLAKELGADVTVCVDVLGELTPYTDMKNIFSLVTRWVEVIDNYHSKINPIDDADLILHPDLGCVSQFKLEKQEFIYKQGYILGKESAQKIKDLLK